MADRPTRTTNRLHFGDLDPSRFEDLCLGLIYSLRPWVDIRHYGRPGGDGGVDILAREPLPDSTERTWIVQCRRYSRAPKSVLIQAVNDALGRCSALPDVLLTIVACDVSRAAQEGYDARAKEMGVGSALLWTESVLEAKLYSERRDLLFSYFDISMAHESRAREQSLRRNMELKRRLSQALLLPRIDDPHAVARKPYKKFGYSRVIVHSIDDTTYPSAGNTDPGISGWFRVELFDFYHNGIECILGIQYALLDADENWALVPYDRDGGANGCETIKVFHLGCIPFRNIVEVDFLGDEYYPEPHFYCRFADGGAPYEEMRYRLCGDDVYPYLLQPEKRRSIDEMVDR